MPLPSSAPRKLSHNRVIDIKGYEREDGLWDVEGHLSDVKTETWLNRAGTHDLPAGVPAHDMWLRITIDLDMVIHDCVAITDGSPYALCGDITPKFEHLKGRRIDRGWTKSLRDVVGGAHGCTHQWELLGRVAAAAFQVTNRARFAAHKHKAGEMPRTFNTCHMYTPDSEQTLHRWPELYTGPKLAEQASKV